MANKEDDKPVTNPLVVLREEFDDWAVLFNPDAAVGFGGFGLNPTGVYVWKLLDGEHSIDELVEKLRHRAEDVPKDAIVHMKVFVHALVAGGLAAYGDTGFYREEGSHALLAPLNEVKPFTYEPPELVNLSKGLAAQGACGNHGSQLGVNCTTGNAAAGCCISGSCGTDNGSCCTGFCGTPPPCCGCGNCQSYCDFNCNSGTCPMYFCESGSTAGNNCWNGNGTYATCGTGTSVG
jgi:SynChlorMet cassette protein ScmD